MNDAIIEGQSHNPTVMTPPDESSPKLTPKEDILKVEDYSVDYDQDNEKMG